MAVDYCTVGRQSVIRGSAIIHCTIGSGGIIFGVVRPSVKV